MDGYLGHEENHLTKINASILKFFSDCALLKLPTDHNFTSTHIAHPKWYDQSLDDMCFRCLPKSQMYNIVCSQCKKIDHIKSFQYS